MDDLPEGYTKIEGFHGVGRDIYASAHKDGLFQIMSKNEGAREWTLGKCFTSEEVMMSEFHAMTRALIDGGYAVTPLMEMEKLPGYGAF